MNHKKLYRLYREGGLSVKRGRGHACGAMTTTTSGPRLRWETRRRPKRAGRLDYPMAPHPARLPEPKPRTMKTKPADSRHE